MTTKGGEAPNRLLSLVGLFQIGTDAPNVELLLFLFLNHPAVHRDRP